MPEKSDPIHTALEFLEQDPENNKANFTFPENWPLKLLGSTKPIFKNCRVWIHTRLQWNTDPEGWVSIAFTSNKTGKTHNLLILEMMIEKQGNPIQVNYSCRTSEGGLAPPGIILKGVYGATYSQLREMWKYAREIKPHTPKGKKVTAKYKPYVDRWRAGESYEDLLAEWEEKNPDEATKNFYRAFWRVGYRTRE